MIYRTTKCPYCNSYLERNNTSNELEFAPSLLPCPHCGNFFKTGKKMWYEMNDKEKKQYQKCYYGWKIYLSTFISNLLLMFIIVFIPVTLLLSLLIKSKDNLAILIAGIIYGISSIILIPHFVKNERNKFEQFKKITYEDFMDEYYNKYYNNQF